MAASESVILLHGLARSSFSMRHLARALSAEGYQVVNQGYPSTRKAIEELACEIIPRALSRADGADRVHFVTHSMGGILLRQYVHQQPLERLGRVVMLAPPNQGSEVVDKLHWLKPYQWLNGPAGAQMGTGPESVPKRLGPAPFELGVIAGSRSINLLLSRLLPKPDDGKVCVENTKLEGMADHLVLPVTHPFIMRNRQVIDQTRHFLRHGTFDH